MKRYIHLKSGNEYVLLQHIYFKIPVFNIWIRLVKYHSINNAQDTYYRFQSNFYNSFKLKE